MEQAAREVVEAGNVTTSKINLHRYIDRKGL